MQRGPNHEDFKQDITFIKLQYSQEKNQWMDDESKFISVVLRTNVS